MDFENWKEVFYNEYCSKCKYKDTKETEDPCNECLTEGVRLNTHKPLNFKEKSWYFVMSKEYVAALKELEIARNHFANADPEFVETAIYEMLAAECKVFTFDTLSRKGV